MKPIKIIFLLIATGILFSCSEETIDAYGTGNVTGTVVMEGSNEPVENVKISTSPSTTTVFTDENGNFLLDDVPEGEYSVQAQKEGLLTAFEGATVRTNAVVNVIFELAVETANNKQPSTPKLMSPEDGAVDVDLNVDFIWTSSDPENDALTYQLELRNDRNNEVLTFSDIQDTVFNVDNLQNGYKYFWQVKVSDSINDTVLSEVNSFTTTDIPGNNYYFVRVIDGNNVIYSSDENGNETRLTNISKNSFRPRKNNTVNKVAYLSTVGGNIHLFSMNPDGSQKTQITSSIPLNGINTEKIGFSWADDGSYLLYPNFDKLYKISSNGGGKEVIYDAPEGRYIMDVQESDDETEIVVLETNLQGYDAKILVVNQLGVVVETILSNVKGNIGGIDISTDNNLILYTRDVSEYENPTGRQLNSKIFIYNRTTKENFNLSQEKPNGTNDLDPRFAPNEASILFVNSSNESVAVQDIYQLEYNEDFEVEEQERTLFIENGKMPDWE